MRKQVSPEVSIHTEFDGLFALQDDRNGNLVVMTANELSDLLTVAHDLLNEYDLSRSLELE